MDHIGIDLYLAISYATILLAIPWFMFVLSSRLPNLLRRSLKAAIVLWPVCYSGVLFGGAYKVEGLQSLLTSFFLALPWLCTIAVAIFGGTAGEGRSQ